MSTDILSAMAYELGRNRGGFATDAEVAQEVGDHFFAVTGTDLGIGVVAETRIGCEYRRGLKNAMRKVIKGRMEEVPAFDLSDIHEDEDDGDFLTPIAL